MQNFTEGSPTLRAWKAWLGKAPPACQRYGESPASDSASLFGQGKISRVSSQLTFLWSSIWTYGSCHHAADLKYAMYFTLLFNSKIHTFFCLNSQIFSPVLSAGGVQETDPSGPSQDCCVCSTRCLCQRLAALSSFALSPIYQVIIVVLHFVVLNLNWR